MASRDASDMEPSTSNTIPSTSDTLENRHRRHKRRSQEKSRSGTQTPKRVNGHVSADENQAGPSTPKEDVGSMEGFGQEDFVAFIFSDDKGNPTAEESPERRPGREWDRGKGKGREYDAPGRKRKVDEVDFSDGYASKKQRLDASSRRAPWAADVDWENCNNVSQLLHREVEAFVKYISPTPVEDEVRSLVVNLISKAVTDAFRDARVLPFGSYETKLYLPLGDIDLVIESQSMAYSNKTSVLHALANVIKRAGITDKVSIIAKAKVPIIKFVTSYGRFSVDMSINQVNGVKAGEIVKMFIKELPALRSLVLIVKSFLSQRSMNEVFTGGLGSYSIVCLAISFLQLHPKIRRGEMDPSKNLGVLVMEFFELYGCYFNYHEVGISVRDGGSYYNKAQRGWSDYRSPGLLSIEDPGDPTNDISKGSFGIAKVRTTFSGAFSIMTAKAYHHANIIAARRNRRYVQLQSRSDPEALSILGSVMGVTQETINQRRLVQEVYDNRVLHRMLGVEPQVPVVISTHSSRKRSSSDHAYEAEASVKSAWEEADSVPEPSSRSRAEDADEDVSRYGIDSRQPPRKRRRTDTRRDDHIYISDEDDEEDDDSAHVPLVVHTLEDSGDERGSDGALTAEEAEYDINGLEEDVPSTKSERAERKRSYWLSKGLGA